MKTHTHTHTKQQEQKTQHQSKTTTKKQQNNHTPTINKQALSELVSGLYVLLTIWAGMASPCPTLLTLPPPKYTKSVTFAVALTYWESLIFTNIPSDSLVIQKKYIGWQNILCVILNCAWKPIDFDEHVHIKCLAINKAGGWCWKR